MPRDRTSGVAQPIHSGARRGRESGRRKELQLRPTTRRPRVLAQRAAKRINVVATERFPGKSDAIAAHGKVHGGSPAVVNAVAAAFATEMAGHTDRDAARRLERGAARVSQMCL